MLRFIFTYAGIFSAITHAHTHILMCPEGRGGREGCKDSAIGRHRGNTAGQHGKRIVATFFELFDDVYGRELLQSLQPGQP